MTTATETKKPAVRVRIEYDELAISPRDPKYYDPFSVFGDWHRRARYGDCKIEGIKDVLVAVSPAGEPEKIDEWYDNALQKLLDEHNLSWVDFWEGKLTQLQKSSVTALKLRKQNRIAALLDKHCVCLPVHMLDHSGVKLQTKPFNIDFDSGQVGYIWIDRAGIEAQWGWKVLTKIRREAIKKALESEIEVYSQYINGDVYYAVCEDEDGEEVDTCGGFFGTDWDTNGIKDHLPEHLRDHTKWKLPWH